MSNRSRVPFVLRHGRTLVVALLLFAPGRSNGQESKPAAIPEGPFLKAPKIPADLDDSVRSLNERLAQNLAPKDNAVVYLVQAFGSDVFERELRYNSLQMLGLGSLSKSAPRFLFLEESVAALGTVPRDQVGEEALQLQAEVFAGAERPWSPKEFPRLVQFLKTNGSAIDAIVAATDKPRYYAPVLSEEDPPRIVSASLVIERRLPFIVQTIAARAMERLSNDDVAGATSDLLACHKLAALLAAGSPLDVSVAKANVLDAVAYRAELSLLKSGKLTGEQATSFRKSLSEISPILSMAQAADIGERAILRQEIELLKTDKASAQGFFDVPGDEKAKQQGQEKLAALNWELATKRADEVQDQIVRALAETDRTKQNELFDQLDRDYEKWNATADAETMRFAKAADKDRDAASRWIGETMAMSMRPLYRQRRATEDRARVRRDLIGAGLALIAYQRDHGEFPAALAEISPKYLQAIPADAHSGKPFAYERRAKDRARLVSWGTNLRDDAGKTYNDDQILDLQ